MAFVGREEALRRLDGSSPEISAGTGFALPIVNGASC